VSKNNGRQGNDPAPVQIVQNILPDALAWLKNLIRL
jgi:hypothetical protein